MLQRIKNIGTRKLIRWAVLFLLSTRMFLHLFYSPEKQYSIFKEIEFNYAVIIFMVILAVYRGITVKDWKAWLYTVIAAVIGVGYFKINDYTSESLGPDYFKWMILRVITQLLFVGLLLDLIRQRPYKRLLSRLKSPMVIVYLLTALLFFIFDNTTVIPLVCPFIILLFTEFSEEDKEEISVIFSLGIYAAFVKVFTGSLIEVSPFETTGRYRGYFLNGPTASESCTTAVIACLFLCLLFKEKKNKKLMVISLIAMLYPLASVFMFRVRGIYLALLLVAIGIFVFMHGRGTKETVKRIGITGAAGIIGVLALFGMSYMMNYLVDEGVLHLTGTSHSLSAILMLASGGNDGDYYAPGTLLNALDNFSSGRIGIMEWFVKQIKFLGHPVEKLVSKNGYETAMAHNVFVQYLARCGILGGGMYILWWIFYTVRTARLLRKPAENPCTIYALLWIMYMLGIYSTQAEFFNCIGAFMLLVSMGFVMGDSTSYRNTVADVEKEKLNDEQ